MNGILVIDKPKGYTSRDVVNIISKKLGIKKIGHTGTLDPIATGVLVLCIGKCSKLAELLVSTKKEYVAKVRLGIETDTLDITGKVVKRQDNINVNKQDILKVLDKFRGNIIQEVPKYSAVSVSGKRLYEYARNNLEVELPKREVTIYDIELLDNVWNKEFSFSCTVSKGTYIRSLIRDIGYSLNTYATMVELRRVKQGSFSIDEAYTLEDIEKDNYKLLSPVEVLDMPKVIVNKDMEFKIKNGQVLKKFFSSSIAMILNQDNELIAIYKEIDEGLVKPFKMF